MQINKTSTLLRMECINIPHEKNTYTSMNSLELLLFWKEMQQCNPAAICNNGKDPYTQSLF